MPPGRAAVPQHPKFERERHFMLLRELRELYGLLTAASRSLVIFEER